MINLTDQNVLRDRGDSGLSAAFDCTHSLVSIRRERRVAPFYAPKTGAVRPQAGVSAMADLTRGIAEDKGLLGVRSWSPPV